MSCGIFTDDPVIVMGMHRSGTTMVSRLLRQMDGQLGADHAGKTDESLLFQRLNIELLLDSGASWHNPKPLWECLRNDQKIELSAGTLEQRLSAGAVEAFWGRRNSVSRTPGFWGWKDPRNTLTLPIWCRVFPNSKIIYIIRNGIDVALSLVERDRREFGKRFRAGLKKRLVRVIPFRWPEYKSRPFTLTEAFELWAEYLSFAEFNTKHIRREKILQLRYEDVLDEPLQSLKQIADFVAPDTTDRTLNAIAKHVKTDRRFAFFREGTQLDFYKKHRGHPQMVKHGYDRLIEQGTHQASKT